MRHTHPNLDTHLLEHWWPSSSPRSKKHLGIPTPWHRNTPIRRYVCKSESSATVIIVIYIYIIYIYTLLYIYICIYIYILHIRMSIVCLPKHEGRTAMSVLPGPTGKRTGRGRKLKWEIQFCHIYGCWRHHASHFPSIAINSSFWSFPPPWKIIPKNTNARITQVMTSWQAFFKKKTWGIPELGPLVPS